MMIAPIIFCTVVHGIASMDDLKRVGRVGLKALIYFEVVTTLALIVGLIVINVLQPGAGMNVDPKTIDTKSIQVYTTKAGQQSTVEFLMNIVPSTIVGAFAEGEILQVLFFSILFAFALFLLGDVGKPVLSFIDVVSRALFGMVGIIMRVAPLGAFGAMAFTIGKYAADGNHHGVASIALILGVDRFMSEARALTNLIGNGVATVVVSKWEGALDEARMRQHLQHETELCGETVAVHRSKYILATRNPLFVGSSEFRLGQNR